MLDWLKSVCNWLFSTSNDAENKTNCVKSANSKKQVTSGISFPVYNPEEYRRQKEAREYKAINGCNFFDELVFDFKENLEHLQNKKCPYCNADLPERKGKSYKCPNCNNKIYRLKDVTTDFEGLFTEEQKSKREKIKKEISRRKNFLKVYDNSKCLVNVELTNNKNDNIAVLILSLHQATKYTKSPKKVNNLRMCRFYEGEICSLIEGYEKQALNAWLSVAYIDLWGWYNYMHDYKNDYKNTFDKRDEEIFNEIKQAYEDKGMKYHYSTFEEYKQREIDNYNKSRELFTSDERIAPYVLEKIIKSYPDFENLKDLFWFNAKELTKNVKYKPPIGIDEAWEKILNQLQKLKNSQTK